MEVWPEFLGHDGVREFVAGGVSGMAGVVAGHPLDTLKVRLQQPAFAGQSGGALSLLQSAVLKEGPRALYKGMGSPLLSVAFQNALLFNTYATIARALEGECVLDEDGRKEPLSYRGVGVAGAGAGLVQTAILCPIDLLKIQLQTQTERRLAPAALTRLHIRSSPSAVGGPLAMASLLMRKEGIRGFYRGLPVTLIRDVPGHLAYFMSYEYARELLHPGCRKQGDEGLSTMLAAGGFAGAFSWLVIYPADVIKSRIQAQPVSQPRKYKGAVDCLLKSVKQEGISVLFRGLGTTMVRAFIVNAATFAAYESTLRVLQPVPRQALGF